MLKKIVCLGSAAGDTPADQTLFDSPSGELKQGNCSYTSPRAQDLAMVLSKRGPNRVVTITFDSRNWKSYGDKGVLVAWSDGEPEWLTYAHAHVDYGISQAEWDDPAGQLFGKKAPFQYTHE